MELEVRYNDRILEISMRGELDHHGAKGLLSRMEQELEMYLPGQLVMDFSGVTFMDSAGIAVAVRSWQRMRELGGSVTLRNVPPQPKKVFIAAGVARMMTIQ